MNSDKKRERRLMRSEFRHKKNKERKKTQRRTERCESCGGTMTWCESCGVFSKTCCEMYGTCMCS